MPPKARCCCPPRQSSSSDRLPLLTSGGTYPVGSVSCVPVTVLWKPLSVAATALTASAASSLNHHMLVILLCFCAGWQAGHAGHHGGSRWGRQLELRSSQFERPCDVPSGAL